MKTYYVYIMSNYSGTTLYIGVTNDLERRVQEHKTHSTKGFTDKYSCTCLLYFEDISSINEAIAREKQLKKWSRDKKERLILGFNPLNQDLSASVEMT